MIRSTTWDEVGLPAVLLVNRTEEVPTKTKVESQLRVDLPVVLEVRGEVDLLIVGLVDVRGVHLVRAARVIDSVGNGRGLRLQHELRDAVRTVLAHHIR